MIIVNQSEILLYQTDDGQTKIEVTMDGDTVWLSQAQLCELSQVEKDFIKSLKDTQKKIEGKKPVK